MPKNSLKIGIIGAGRLGTTLARALSTAGYQVFIANSRGPDSLELQLKILLPGVRAQRADDLIHQSDVVILAVPLREYRNLPLSQLTNKIVIDAMNYWAPVDGTIVEFDNYALSSSEQVAAAIPTAHVIKTFNAVAYNELEEHAQPPHTIDRRGIPLAGDNKHAKTIASELINAIGFDPADLGKLTNGKLFQPDTQLFNARLSAAEIAASLKIA